MDEFLIGPWCFDQVVEASSKGDRCGVATGQAVLSVKEWTWSEDWKISHVVAQMIQEVVL